MEKQAYFCWVSTFYPFLVSHGRMTRQGLVQIPVGGDTVVTLYKCRRRQIRRNKSHETICVIQTEDIKSLS